MARETAPSLNESMRLIASNLMNTMQLTNIFYGTVTKVSPLEIMVDQKLILPEPFLLLSNMVKDHSVDITVSMQTVEDDYLAPAHTHGNGNNGSPTTSTSDFDTTHKHDIKGRKKITFHYGLKVGEKVVLLRMQGGKKYLVLDRIETPITNGEWL